VVDDTPDTVLLSAFDPAKREIGVTAMKRLINDGGFTPGHIEQVVADCQSKLEEEIGKEGKRGLEEIKATNYHPELPHYVGMMKYRTTYGQNLLQHSLEVAKLAAVMASELGLDVKLAMRAGLLHDIGKTLSREMEGSHIELGIDLGERFNEHPVVREVIAEHHEHHERQSSICFLVRAADTVSSTRPGGRREDLEGYAQRIMKLEEIANSFEGVRDVYAINAGREMRVMVRGDRISDDDAEMLAFDIAERVKSEVTFAGEVKVMVVRETRAVRYSGRGRNRRNQNNRRSRPRRSKSAVPAR
jgi:ribonuclease Y